MNDKAVILRSPVMLDRVVAEIQEGLAELGWLDVVFGRAQRITRMQDGKRIVAPNVYCGGWQGHGPNDYMEVSPDANIGNFAYFETEDPETLDAGPWARTIKSPFSLVVWFDLRRIWPEDDCRDTEILKAEVLRLLAGRTGWHLSNGRVSVSKIYERAENIYRGYTLSEIDNQYLMHPYYGFRFEGMLEFSEICF